MASNPMQKKARGSFILGMLLMTLILGAVIGLLVLQLKDYKDKEAKFKSVYVLNQDIASGQVITKNMLETKKVDETLIPSNAILNLELFDNFQLTDKEGNEISTEYKNNTATLYLSRDNSKYELKSEEITGAYYIEKNGNKEYIDTATVPIVGKVSMKKNTVITTELLAKSNETTTDDLRKQEYNMIVLPSQLESNEYIDIRLALPTGQDYIVASKKEVTIPTLANGTFSETDICLNMTEEEIITMNNAIVDAYRIEGSKLYATVYTEAGTQNAATPTYIPSAEVMQLIEKDPNIVTTAREGLIARYNTNHTLTRDTAINGVIQDSGDKGEENVKTKVEESITDSQSSRKKYLDSLTTGTNTTK